MTSDWLEYYKQPGPMTSLGQYAGLVDQLPAQIGLLVKALQGLAVHIFWAERYGLHLDGSRQAEVQIHTAERKLARLLELSDRPLSEARPPEQRLVCNCRDFSVLMASFLRARGVPCRARCGFGTYFISGHYEDHWMVEVWDAEQQSWRQVDAQLDELMLNALKIQFDPLDMPAGAFVTGGAAWRMCREGQAAPDTFGIMDYKGWDFVRGNVLRDALSLLRVEVLPWDGWGILEGVTSSEMPAADMDLIDRLAAAAEAGDSAEVERIVESDERLPFSLEKV